MKKITIKILVGLMVLFLLALPLAGACAEEEVPKEVPEEVPEEYSLKITAVGEGTTSPKPGTSTITEGESVTVKATPNPGYEFDRWEGDVSGTSSSITVKMTSDKSVVAVFVEEVVVEKWEWPDVLYIGTMGPATNNYATAVAWSTPLAADSGMKCRLVSEEKVPEMLDWVITGETLCASWGGSDADMFEAVDIWASADRGPRPVAYMYVSSRTDIGFVVRGDSTIKTPYDIKPGTKIIYYVWMPKTVYEALLAWGNVSPDDVEWYGVSSITASVAEIIADPNAVVFAYPTTPFNYDIENCPQGASWIELNAEEDPEGAARFTALSPQTFGVMSSGMESAHGVPSMVSVNGYMVRQDSDPDLVYNLTKWLDENYDKYKDGSPDTPGVMLENVVWLAEHNFKPLHDGTVRYLEEKGLWTEAHETRRQANLELLDLWIAAYKEAIALAKEQGLTIGPDNEEWIEFWNNYKAELPKFKMFPGLG